MFVPTWKRARWAATALALSVAGAAGTATASEMVYYPINPTFGGSPLNGAVLLNRAQAQNKHKEPEDLSDSRLAEQTPLQQFNDMLERSVLNRLASAATQQFTGVDGRLQPGTVETGNFIIDIVDMGGGLLKVTTTDRILGTSTSFEVGR